MSQLLLQIPEPGERRSLGEGAVLLRGFALERAPVLLEEIEAIAAAAPFRHMPTRGGRSIAAEMTNCGPLGWVSDRTGYRYASSDPASGRPWPAIPATFRQLATEAARVAGFADFRPDACLVNRYHPGAGMALHRDDSEAAFDAPIVSVSLGLPIVFLFGGFERGDPAERIRLAHGDVVVWGGPARLRYHGVLPLRPGHPPAVGACRYTLTFRRAAP